jgi:uncharacterized protein (TIGR03437 family)
MIYCAGLGVTDPVVADGASVSTPVLIKAPVTITIGGQAARLVESMYPADAAPFGDTSGFIPGLLGVYGVTVEMPSGVAAGDSVPVTVTAAGQTSPVVSLPVR